MFIICSIHYIIVYDIYIYIYNLLFISLFVKNISVYVYIFTTLMYV